MFSIFEEADEGVLLQQCQHDLALWGFDAFQCQTFAAEILQDAKAALLTQNEFTDPPAPSESMEVLFAGKIHARTGVTAEDCRWYWSLPPLARAVMHRFDEALRWHMEFDRSCNHLCVEELEEDLRQSLPTFGHAETTDSDDAPLPWELRRRLERFFEKTRQNERAFREWSERTRRSSSMNALIREEIRAGRL